MPFKVTHAKWLETEVERITGFVLMPQFWHRAWTPQSLKAALQDIGLYYSLPEISEINDKLHELGIIEDVTED